MNTTDNDVDKSLNNNSGFDNSASFIHTHITDSRVANFSSKKKNFQNLTLKTSESKKVSVYETNSIQKLKSVDTSNSQIKSMDSTVEKENYSPLRKFMGSIGKGIGNFGKGIGSHLGKIGNGIGNMGKNMSKGLGLNQIGKGLGMVSKGLGLDRLGKGLEVMGKHGLKQLNILSKGLGLDVLGKGLNNLSKAGLGHLGKGLKDLTTGQYLKKLQEQIRKIAYFHFNSSSLLRFKFRGKNSDVLTEREKKIQFIKGHMKRSDTIAAIIALLCLVLSYYEVYY